MKTGCKSCQNWTPENGDEGWCANFKKKVFHNPSCGEWRRRTKEPPPGDEQGRISGRDAH